MTIQNMKLLSKIDSWIDRTLEEKPHELLFAFIYFGYFFGYGCSVLRHYYESSPDLSLLSV